MSTATKTTDTIYPDVVPGTRVRVSVRIKDVNKKGEEKERIQVFEGLVLARKHGSETGATITVRKLSGNIGVEKIFPLHSPVVAGIEVVAKYRVRQAKINYARNPKFKKKMKEIKDSTPVKKVAKKKATTAKAQEDKPSTPAVPKETPSEETKK